MLVLTLSIVDHIKFLGNVKQGIKRAIYWNKYRFQIAEQPKNNLDFPIDPTFRNFKRLFLLSLKNDDDDTTRGSSDEYYMTVVKTKD